MNTKREDFKVVVYYPAWQTELTGKIRYDLVTNVMYSFAIPTENGGLMPLRNPQVAEKILKEAHEHGVKVSLAVGGWDYLGERLEATFAKATDTPEKILRLADEILAMCAQYGFDGIDIDWEYPRISQDSGKQYETLMLYLSEKLHAQGKLLTSAVISGVWPDGRPQEEAQAHNEAVIDAVDWLNVMTYDGGEGEDHSSYEFAVSCCDYWLKERGVEKKKVVMGVPFYGRPAPGSYRLLIEADPQAYLKDSTEFQGKTVYYNGVPTMTKKAEYALENCGGIMAWEASEDTSDENTSLMHAIGKVVCR